jgi:transcriptional regulator with XRE-family HTH domain
MEDRIRKFMEYKGISPSELADTIGVQRSNITHVLNGRNKPSFQFIEKMLQIYPDLNAKWLLLGTGAMVDTPSKSRNLFDQGMEIINQTPLKNEKTEKFSEIPISQELKPEQVPEKIVSPISEKTTSTPTIEDQIFSSEKPIERLIVFYNDSTFKVYNPSR